MMESGSSSGYDRPRRGLVSWAVYDWANSSFSTVIQTFVFAAYFTRRVASTEVEGSTLWGVAIGSAGITIALFGPVFGAIADQSGRRKPWLAAFTAMAVLATASLWFIPPDPSSVLPAMVLIPLAVIGTELAILFYNAMLPHLAGSDRIGRWSGWGWALGYAGGLVCLALCLLAFVRQDAWFDLDRGRALHIRITFVFVAGWYTLFSLPLSF